MSTATSVMDEKYRESLQRHYRLLMTHIQLNDDVIKQMAEEKILPYSMIKDIEEAETREERNECLLKSLHLRGNKCYRRFRELMYRTGNFFVADLMWDEGEGAGSLDEGDLLKFPGLLDCVPDTHRKRLTNFLEAKEKSLKDTIATQETKDLESSLHAEAENCRVLRLELSGHRQQMQQVRKDHLLALDVQTRFHDANLSTITRLKDYLVKCKEGVRALNETIKRKLEIGAAGSDDGAEGDEWTEDDPKLDILEYNERANQGENQRQEVLKLLNRRYTKDPLVNVVKEVLRHEQKHRSLVMRDIFRLAQSLKKLTPGSSLSAAGSASGYASMPHGAQRPNPNLNSCLPDPTMLDTKHFKTELAMLKAEVEHIHKRLQWKDSEIADQQKEIVYLKQRLGEFPRPSPSPPVCSPSQITAACSSSQISLEQPFHTPVDQGPFLQDDDPEAKILHRLDLGRVSQISPSPPHPLPHTSAQRSSLTPRQEGGGGGGGGGGGRDSKTVTFEELVSSGVHKPRGRSRGAASSSALDKGVVRPDPDKTLVSAEQYLQEETKVAQQPEAEVGVRHGRRAPPKAAPSRGEGDINSNYGRARSARGGSAAASRAAKRGEHK
ncbi:hypothetical protein ACOMHN_032764 [Nucella lapillus]